MQWVSSLCELYPKFCLLTNKWDTVSRFGRRRLMLSLTNSLSKVLTVDVIKMWWTMICSHYGKYLACKFTTIHCR